MNKLNLARIITITIALLLVSFQVVYSQVSEPELRNCTNGADQASILSCLCEEEHYATTVAVDGSPDRSVVRCQKRIPQSLPPVADGVTCNEGQRIKSISNNEITECVDYALLSINPTCVEGSRISTIKANGELVCSPEGDGVNDSLNSIVSIRCNHKTEVAVKSGESWICKNKLPQNNDEEDSIAQNELLLQGEEGFESKLVDAVNEDIYPSVFKSVSFEGDSNLLKFSKDFEVKNKLNTKGDRSLNIRARQVCSDEDTCVDVPSLQQQQGEAGLDFAIPIESEDCPTGSTKYKYFYNNNKHTTEDSFCSNGEPAQGLLSLRGVAHPLRIHVRDNHGVSRLDGIINTNNPLFWFNKESGNLIQQWRANLSRSWIIANTPIGQATIQYFTIKLTNVKNSNDVYWSCASPGTHPTKVRLFNSDDGHVGETVAVGEVSHVGETQTWSRGKKSLCFGGRDSVRVSDGTYQADAYFVAPNK